MAADALAFVTQTALGWRTYSSQLEDAISRRPAMPAGLIPFTFPSTARVFTKVTNLNGVPALVRRVDPITLMRSWAGRGVRRKLDAERFGAAHFAGHWLSAAVAYRDPGLPFTVSMDATRVNIRDDLRQGKWTPTEIGRERDLLGRAAHLYPLSSWAARSLEEDYGIDPGRITVIPPSLDLGSIPDRPLDNVGDRPTRILFVGNDFVRKGGPRLLNWMNGPLKGSCELFIASARYRDGNPPKGVHVLGAVDNRRLVTEILPTMDLLCHPTLSDMSAYVVAEAAAAGRPVVASRVGGIGDLVVDGETGLLADPESDDDFLKAIRSLNDDPERMMSMGRNAREHAEKHFDHIDNFNVLIDNLENLVR